MENCNIKKIELHAVDSEEIESLEQEIQRFDLNDDDKIVNNSYRNPFLIMEIVDNLFPYMDFKSKQANRLVCKLWNHVSTPILRPNSHIYFKKAETDDAVSVFLKTLETSSTFPLSKVTILLPTTGPSAESLKFFESLGKELEDLTLIASRTFEFLFVGFLNSILDKICPNLKHLTLKKLHYTSFREVALSTNSLGNLKSLTVELVESYLYSNPLQAVAFLTHLISRAPKLEKITTNFMNSRELFFKFYKGLKDVGINSSLTELNLDHAGLDNPDLELLNQMEFPKLKVLRISSLKNNSVAQRFIKFLTAVSPSLQKLVLEGCVGNQKLIYTIRQRSDAGLKLFKLPLMKKLRIFENRNVEGFQMGSIEFLKRFPNLDELLLENFGVWAICNAAPWRDLFPEGINSESLGTSFGNIRKVHIKTIFRSNRKNLICLRRMISCFPQLERFQTAVSLYGDFEMLGEFLSVLSTSGITGLTLEFRESTELLDESTFINFEKAIMTYLPCFKRLQRLHLEVSDWETGSKLRLSSEAVSEGFCKVDSLTALTLIGFELGSDEDEMRKTLSKKCTYLEV